MSDMAGEPTTTEPEKRPDSILTAPGAAAAVVPAAPTRHRPIMVTILAIGAGILAVLSAVHLLQALGIIPFVIGRLEIRAFSLFHAIMWGLLVWVWGWLVQMLWKVEPQAWIFLVVVSMFNLVLDFVLLLGETSWADVSLSFLVNAVILLYCLLPGTRRAFERE
ncbi:MAG TPA: hypothetical protein VFH48_02860 [Chloroflexota bacterium]|nr:hypothetical protein [Chloroflexota bacterium]